MIAKSDPYFEQNILKSSSRMLRRKAEEAAARNPKSLEILSVDETHRLIHELQVHQIELEMQNEQLHLTQVELDRERNRYIDLYNLAPVGYCTLNMQGKILQANLTALNLFGKSQSDLINQSITQFILHEDQDIYYLCQKQSDDFGESRFCELRMIGKNDKPFWAHLETRDGHNPDNIYESHLIISDITKYTMVKEKLKLNEQIMLAQAQKAAMGDLISMIAHQWRQPLNNLALINQDMYIKLELGKLDDKSIYESHEKVDQILQFMSKTIDDFRNFFSPDQPKEWVTIEEVIECTLKIIGQCYVTTNIAINIHNNSQSTLLIHKNSLVQVFLNILENAKHTLETENVKPAIITVIIEETVSSIITTIRDNGGGIPEAIIDKIAQPYFTTKGLMGTGLGLYISQTIIEKYFSGSFTWFNKNQGACFVITLDKHHV
ncbi:PAS domain-containing sensor histidine kinase [Sulfuricurvum sp.]|uniref:PAS domain-containing sensor histidine kinase n=1 Tax=Sulfuricurvum sp. TaxID=2025608 RepID=UPI002E33E6F4|nr:PAS domain-containing sensor histidine kinase [Sulfuricurvum sp.]HEX5329227.1 PAS domain-containing sensor histidine kinase [Sulfuricurvum sp.]